MTTVNSHDAFVHNVFANAHAPHTHARLNAGKGLLENWGSHASERVRADGRSDATECQPTTAMNISRKNSFPLALALAAQDIRSISTSGLTNPTIGGSLKNLEGFPAQFSCRHRMRGERDSSGRGPRLGWNHSDVLVNEI